MKSFILEIKLKDSGTLPFLIFVGDKPWISSLLFLFGHLFQPKVTILKVLRLEMKEMSKGKVTKKSRFIRHHPLLIFVGG